MRFLPVLLLTFGLVSLVTPTALAQKIQWLRSATDAAQVAAETGKPILVYVRSASCHYCDLMQQNVWQDPAMAQRITRDFVPLKLTREDNAEAVKVLKIKGFPSTLVFSPDRRFLHRVDGYVAPQKFMGEMTKVRQATLVSSRR